MPTLSLVRNSKSVQLGGPSLIYMMSPYGGEGYISKMASSVTCLASGCSFFGGGGQGVPPRAYRILVPGPGTDPTVLAVKARSPKHWIIREFLPGCSLIFFST